MTARWALPVVAIWAMRRDSQGYRGQAATCGRRRQGSPAGSADVKRRGAEGLDAIDDERGADLPGAFANADEIDEGAIHPVTTWNTDDGGAIVDGAEDGFCPTHLRIAFHRNDLCRVAARGFAPGEDVGGEVLREDDDGASGVDFDIGGGDGHAVADGRDECNRVSTRAEKFAGQRAEFLCGRKPVRAAEGPRRGFDAYGVEPGGGYGLQLRRHVGAVQVGDAGRDFKEMCGLDGFHTVHAGTGTVGRDTLIL